MTVQDLGSIGELIAAVATVATLIYLALQIRASTVVSKAEAQRATRSTSSATNLAVVNNSDVARILRTGLGDPSQLEPDESIRFFFFMGELIGNFGEQHREVTAGILPEEQLENQVVHLKRFLTTPGGEQFWQQFGPGFPKEFRQYVQRRVIAESSSSQPNPPPGSAA